MLRVDGEDPPGSGGGAAPAQRAAAAPCLELCLAVAIGLGRPSAAVCPGRAGDRALAWPIDGEAVDGEAPGDGLRQRGRLDHCRVAACPQVLAQLAGAVGGIAQDG